jgi:hypothetical protein
MSVRSMLSKPVRWLRAGYPQAAPSLRRRYSSARVPGGQGSAGPLEIGVKAIEAVQSLERSREELPGVWGAGRIESGGGNWGGPPRPGSLRFALPERGVL